MSLSLGLSNLVGSGANFITSARATPASTGNIHISVCICFCTSGERMNSMNFSAASRALPPLTRATPSTWRNTAPGTLRLPVGGSLILVLL